MKSRPIIMRADEVRAIIDGRKTQLRRPVKWPVLSACDGSKRRVYTERDIAEMNERLETRQRHPSHQFCPHGQLGDRLWVRETWRMDAVGAASEYRATTSALMEYIAPWRSPIHMPRRASRITLEIVRVRVERVQDITEEDAKAEGVKIGEDRSHSFAEHGLPYRPHRDAFPDLWQSIYGNWDFNPWVWVVEFRRTK